MARVCVVVIALCLSVATAVEYKSAAAATIPFNAQDQYLAKQAIANFGCRVDSVVVKTEVPGTVDAVKVDDIRGAFSQVATLEWAHIAQSSFTTIDGRNDEKVLGTPGGDLGEFIQALQAFAQVSGRTLSEEEIQQFLEKFIRVMSKEKFGYLTDEKAYIRLAVATGCRNLRISEMGGLRRKQANLLAQVAKPEHLGDPFIKFMAINATEIGVDAAYIKGALSAYHNILWTSPSRASAKLCYLELKGQHKEAALVNIKTPSFCTDQGLAPMISPEMTCSAPVMINHPEAAKLLRREMAAVLTDGTDVDAAEVLAVHNSLAETNLEKFMSEFGPELPVFSVQFKASSPVLSDLPQPDVDED